MLDGSKPYEYRGVKFFIWKAEGTEERCWYWSIGHKEPNFYCRERYAADAMARSMAAIDAEIWTRYGD